MWRKINFSSIECDKEGLELALFLQEGDDVVFVPVENRFINSGYLIVFNSLYDNKITYLRGNSDFFSFFFSDNINYATGSFTAIHNSATATNNFNAFYIFYREIVQIIGTSNVNRHTIH